MQKYDLKTLRLIFEIMFNNDRCDNEFLKEIEYLIDH